MYTITWIGVCSIYDIILCYLEKYIAYNDCTCRRCSHKGSWLLGLTLWRASNIWNEHVYSIVWLKCAHVYGLSLYAERWCVLKHLGQADFTCLMVGCGDLPTQDEDASLHDSNWIIRQMTNELEQCNKRPNTSSKQAVGSETVSHSETIPDHKGVLHSSNWYMGNRQGQLAIIVSKLRP